MPVYAGFFMEVVLVPSYYVMCLYCFPVVSLGVVQVGWDMTDGSAFYD